MVDVERLAQFSDGTTDGLLSLVRIFLDDILETGGALRAAVASRNADDVTTLAHRASGTSGACGAAVLSALLSRLEAVGRDGADPAASEALMDEINRELSRVTLFLEAYIERGGEQR